MRDTSLVTNMEEKNTPKTRNRERTDIRFRLDARDTRGRKTFSRLNPSSTLSIMNSVPKVRQSMSARSRFVGGVMTSATAAASSDTASMGSFFRRDRTFFMTVDIPFFQGKGAKPSPGRPGTVPGL